MAEAVLWLTTSGLTIMKAFWVPMDPPEGERLVGGEPWMGRRPSWVMSSTRSGTLSWVTTAEPPPGDEGESRPWSIGTLGLDAGLPCGGGADMPAGMAAGGTPARAIPPVTSVASRISENGIARQVFDLMVRWSMNAFPS